MKTTAVATLPRRSSRQLQEASASKSADRGQKVLATASSKKKIRRSQFSPLIFWTWRQWKPRRRQRCNEGCQGSCTKFPQRSRLMARKSWRRPRQKKKLGVRNFPPDFLDLEAMETTAPATLQRRLSRQLQEASASKSADRGQKVLATASSKKIRRSQFSP